MKRQKLKKVTALIGPYPYNPYLIFLFFFSIQASRLFQVIPTQAPGFDRYRALAVVLLLSSLPATVFSVTAALVQKTRVYGKVSLFRYICEITFGQLLVLIWGPVTVSVLKSLFNYEYEILVAINFRFFLFSLLTTLVSFALMHQAERNILERLSRADDLVKKLKSDREDLVNLDESIRRQTAQILHDRVQSDLMTVAMKLKSIYNLSDKSNEEVLQRAISRLEKTRSADLKNLIQSLSPNFQVTGFEDSLKVLATQYEESMKINFKIDSSCEILPESVLLGLYRIIEQGLMNSFHHGPARNVYVEVMKYEKHENQLSITDDGPGTDLEFVESGVGTAVIDSWVGILEGKKEVDTVPGHGYRLVVIFPAD